MISETKSLKIVCADTYTALYGAEIVLFGVADSKEDTDKICEYVVSQGYSPIVSEVSLNEICEEYLGGYYE